jgi:hypothetical protein
MSVRKTILTAGAAALALLLAACHGGGGGNQNVVTINSITLNPAQASVGSVNQLSANISGADAGAIKTWSVTAGDLSLAQPDFAFVLRSAAKAASASSVSTANAQVYWIAPATPGSVTITLTVGSASKSQTVSVGTSLVSMDVTDIAGGKKLATVKVNGVTDLYQAAFRVQYSSAWKPESAAAGPFLGAGSDILFMGLTNQNGFVPVSITRKGDVGGVDGSGTLATVTFAPNSGASSVRGASSAPFDVAMVVLRDSHDQAISN